MGVGRFEVLPIFFAEVTEVVRSHGVPAEVGHGLEVLVVERRLSEFGRDGLETTSLAYKKSSKHSANEGMGIASSRTLLRLANLHRDVRERNLNRPWPHVLLVAVILIVVIGRVHHISVDARVHIGVVRVNLTSTDERVTVPGLTVASSRVSTASSIGVRRRDGVLSLKSMRELVVCAVSGLPGGRRRVDVPPDEVVRRVCS